MIPLSLSLSHLFLSLFFCNSISSHSYSGRKQKGTVKIFLEEEEWEKKERNLECYDENDGDMGKREPI